MPYGLFSKAVFGLVAICLLRVTTITAQTIRADSLTRRPVESSRGGLEIVSPDSLLFTVESQRIGERFVDVVTGLYEIAEDDGGEETAVSLLEIETPTIEDAAEIRLREGGVFSRVERGDSVSTGWLSIEAPEGALVSVGGTLVNATETQVSSGAIYIRGPVGSYSVSISIDNMLIAGGDFDIRDRQQQRVRISRGRVVEVVRNELSGVSQFVSPLEGWLASSAPPAYSPSVLNGCEDVPADAIASEAERMVEEADYEGAHACLTRLSAVNPGDIAIRHRISEVDRALASIGVLTGGRQSEVQALRIQARGHVESGDRAELYRTVQRLMDVLPGDPAAVGQLMQYLKTEIAPGDGPSMSLLYIPGPHEWIPDELFRATRGSPPSNGYFLSKTEVTNAHFVAFLNSIESSEWIERAYEVRDLRFISQDRQSGRWSAREGTEDYPVVDATWYGANAYASWCEGRLPSQGEWEWAYRQGEAWTGSANLKESFATSELAPVGAFEPDHLGLSDMLGNVWEWLAFPGTEDDSERRFIAGGSFASRRGAVGVAPVSATSAERTDGHIGFRVAFYLPAAGVAIELPIE